MDDILCSLVNRAFTSALSVLEVFFFIGDFENCSVAEKMKILLGFGFLICISVGKWFYYSSISSFPLRLGQFCSNFALYTLSAHRDTQQLFSFKRLLEAAGIA